MRYFIYIPGSAPFFARDFHPENHFVDGMLVVDTKGHIFTMDGVNWFEIENEMP